MMKRSSVGTRLAMQARAAFVVRGKPPVAAGTWTRIDVASWLAGAGK